jgi:hypothetical protein
MSFLEPYQIGERFSRALQSKALMLEVDALRDELASCTMENADQLRRQRLLVQVQRDEAERFRDFLTRTVVRPTSSRKLAKKNPSAAEAARLTPEFRHG